MKNKNQIPLKIEFQNPCYNNRNFETTEGICMTDQEFDSQFLKKTARERELTKEILLDIVELDRRKLYLKYAYSSLFAYLTQRAGYSDSAAQRRIDAARLLAKVPEVSEAISDGRIHLSQASKVQQICRQVKKETGTQIEVAKQKDLLKKLENKNSRQTDLILAQEFNLEIKTHARTKIQQDESVRVELTFSKEEMELIEEARALLSNQTGGELKESFVLMARKIVNGSKPKKLEKTVCAKNLELSKPKERQNLNIFTAAAAVGNIKKPIFLRSVTPKLKREVLHEEKCCQFIDPETGQMCGSIYFLEVDHIQPRFLNGPSTRKNLRTLCRNHNQYRFRMGI